MRATHAIWLYVLASLVAAMPVVRAAENAAGLSRATGFTVAQARQIVGEKSRQVIRTLQNNDTVALARYAHPAGVRFAPYAHLEPEDLVFRRATLATLGNSRRIYQWGHADGTGDPIRSTWNSFRTRYLVPKGRDFLKATEVNYNTFKARGNTLNNLREKYPGAIFVEFHLPGTDKYSYMDWRSAWLVWRPVGKIWHLRAIAGDQWTT